MIYTQDLKAQLIFMFILWIRFGVLLKANNFNIHFKGKFLG
jgi:hypothetical protein